MKLPDTERRVGAVTVPEPETIVRSVVEALFENVFAAAPRRVVVAKAYEPVSVPEIVWVMPVPEK